MYLNNNKMKADSPDKGLGFCLMTENAYLAKLEEILTVKQFIKKEITDLKETTLMEMWREHILRYRQEI